MDTKSPYKYQAAAASVLRFGVHGFGYLIHTCIPGGSGAVEQNPVSTAKPVSTAMPVVSLMRNNPAPLRPGTRRSQGAVRAWRRCFLYSATGTVLISKGIGPCREGNGEGAGDRRERERERETRGRALSLSLSRARTN